MSTEHSGTGTAPSTMRRSASWLVQRLRRMSLRHRLVLVLLALLLISCLLVTVVTSLLMHRFLLERLDQQLSAAGNRFALSLEHPGDGDSDDAQFDSVAGQAAGTLGARVSNGTVTAISVVAKGAESAPPSPKDRSTIANLVVSSTPRSIHLANLGEYRVLVTAGRDGDVLVTGLPQEDVNETVGQLVAIEATVFAAALLLTGVAGAVCVRLSLRPLNRVAGTALRVSDLPLSSGAVSLTERVENPAPGTEVGQVADAFNHMLSHVESALSARQRSEDQLRHFIADASHELRTPIAVIRSHAEFTQQSVPGLPEEADQAFLRIAAESKRMGGLVEDLLLLARLDSGRPLATDEVDLTRMAIDAVSDARVAGRDHRWELDFGEEPAYVRGDEHALHQVLANLLSNARTHTPAGTTVWVEVLEKGDSVELRVRDNGPGIAADIVPHIFERFVRGDPARSRATDSTGLGLSIASAIVHAHKGTITVNSRAGRTEFVIDIPAEATHATEEPIILPTR
jgi:two-component system OmpR family sensor kinase